MAQLPVVGLLACQTGAVHAALLARTDADGLAVLHVADAVGLGVFQHDQADDEVAALLVADDLVLGHNVLQHRLIGNVQVLTALLEGHAKDRAGLQRLRLIVGVDLDDGIAALLLGFQHLQRVGVVAGRNDAVGDLMLNQLRGAQVADIGQRDPVAEAGHTVRTAGTGVGAGQRGKLGLRRNVVHGAQGLIQRQTDGRTGRGDVLEAGGSGLAECLLQIAHELPGVERIQKVDVTRASVQNLHRQVTAVRHVDAGGLLVGVRAVFQLKFVHINPPQRCIYSG